MKTLKKVEIQPVYVYYMPEVLEENKVYISEEFGVAIHNCLCGCKEKTVTPLGKNEWTLTKHTDEKISLSPSILNRFPCKSHYILTKNVANFV